MRRTLISTGLIFSMNLVGGNLPQESYWDIQSVSNPSISPDGKHVIFAKKFIDKQNDKRVTEHWIMESDGSNKRFFVEGSNPRWSPSSKKIAYVNEDENKKSQIYVKNLINEPESKITNFSNDVRDFSWSPDGEYLVYMKDLDYHHLKLWHALLL